MFPVLAVLTLGIPACRSTSTIDELQDLKTKACQCADMACVDALQDSTIELQKKLGALSESDQKKALAIAVEIMECSNVIAGGSNKP